MTIKDYKLGNLQYKYSDNLGQRLYYSLKICIIHVLMFFFPLSRFKDNQGKTKFPLGAEGVGIVVKLGQNATKLKVKYPKLLITNKFSHSHNEVSFASSFLLQDVLIYTQKYMQK